MHTHTYFMYLLFCSFFPKLVYLYGVLTPFKLRVALLGRMILPLSPGLRFPLGALGRMLLLASHLLPPCLPHVSPTGPHDHLSPTLGAVCRMILHFSPTFSHLFHFGRSGPHDFTLVPHLSPTLVSHWAA